MKSTLIALALTTAFAATAYGADPAPVVQRDVNQQQRIEQGLQSGQLTTREAGKLEGEETHVEHMESQALKDGHMSKREKARIERAENRTSADIARDKHNDRLGNPDSVSSQRMQADVARNVNQQQRIEQGIQNGTLTNREVAGTERAEARDTHAEAVAGRNGHVGVREQRHIQHDENAASGKIWRKKHNAADRG